jgi:hypothetical protein
MVFRRNENAIPPQVGFRVKLVPRLDHALFSFSAPLTRPALEAA